MICIIRQVVKLSRFEVVKNEINLTLAVPSDEAMIAVTLVAVSIKVDIWKTFCIQACSSIHTWVRVTRVVAD